MTQTYSLGIIGLDGAATAVAKRLGQGTPFEAGPLKLVAWAKHEGSVGDAVSSMARASGVPYVDEWRRLAEDPGVDAVFVGGPYGDRAAAVISALRHGKAVLCPSPVALTPSELDLVEAASVEGNGVLLAPSRLEVLAACRAGLQQIGRGGPLQSVYYAARRAFGSSQHHVLDELGWDALHFLQLCIGVPLVRSYVANGELFGNPDVTDTAVIVLRFENGVVATLELSDCLPVRYDPGAKEHIEVEVISDQSIVRIEPNLHTLRVFGDAAAGDTGRPHWHAHPAVTMLGSLVGTLAGGQGRAELPAALRPVLDMMIRLREPDQVQRSSVPDGVFTQ